VSYNGCYDKEFKDKITSECNRGVRRTAKHEPEKHKAEVLAFIKENNRPPSIAIAEEKALYYKYSYYTGMSHNKVGEDTYFVDSIVSIDKCHKSTIPYKYRRHINGALEEQLINENEIYNICK
jgi:hypothetical protein